MAAWEPTRRDQKQYPHFDAPLPLRELRRVANDPKAVASNKFFPFLRYEDAYRPFRPKGKPVKKRPIRYGTRRDAAIFSRYRSCLSELYEKELDHLGITDCVLAYRRIPVEPAGVAGKCNIHHARDAFDRIIEIGHCCAVVMDISSYFENLDHSHIKKLWCRLLGVGELPEDHYAVFKAITRYRVVDSRKAYEALGYFGTKPSGFPGYLVPKRDMPKQLCSPKEFREKICGEAPGFSNLIESNSDPFGIPQGAPLSDLLANLYLLDFDVEMHKRLSGLGGFYMRYSDDILLIVPGGACGALDLMHLVRSRIRDFGANLRIKEEKCSVHEFSPSKDGLTCAPVFPAHRKGNGLSYLGFRFDGKYVYLRDETLSALWRKISARIAGETVGLVKRYPGKSLTFIQSKFDPNQIVQRVGRVRYFDRTLGHKSWTFWTYAKRASEAFGGRSRIYRQLANYRRKIRAKARARLARTYFRSL